MTRQPKPLLRALRNVVDDGGGAFVVEASDDPKRGFLEREFRSDAAQWRHAIGGCFSYREAGAADICVARPR